jgi:protein involved in polysaccharide export with SLBB domain
LDVWGLTLTETKNLLEKEYGKFTRNPPQIGVTLRGIDSKKIWLLGRFQVPGAYPMASPVTLLEALSLAGGTQSLTASTGQQEITPAMNAEELADLRRAFVIRNGKLLPVDFERLVKKGDFSQNIYLQPDDFVYMPPATAREVYVMGAVAQPRVVPFQDGMTLVSAIANAGGTFKESQWSQVAVVRGSLAQPQVTVVDYKAIAKGLAPDFPLESHDIIYVPHKPYRHLMRYVDLILNTFVTTVAINEGARSVATGTPPTGIVIPLGSTITIGQPTPISVR